MNQNKEVIERLLGRRDGKKDKYKIGLVIEGGGMRGAFSGGAMVALEKLGLTDCFDYVYASSSGCCSGAYFLTKQTKLGVSIYQKDARKIIKPWRLNRAADIDYLCDVLFRTKKKLDTERLSKSKTVLKVFVADASNGECLYYTNKDKVDIIQAIKASCALPAFYNKAVKIGNKKYLDGRIGKALPIEDAIADGCTDILIVTTVPEFYRFIRDNWIARTFKKIIMFKFPRQYRTKYKKERLSNYNENLDIAFGKKPIEPNTYTISPDQILSKFETNPVLLDAMIEEGKAKTEKAFGS
jgi:predicted patatin/cPLA2 family phospholipase